ncbi:AAC(3) family N-acetyltransferase [Campylobacter lari]|uniref:AAC(3) family N-acetyltransferase n=1 Tax=Campylobacter lari TaxID=201 RepID=UPI00126CDE7F|nr:AAC(3) family N-acetyltransferase [Campylobacter lari]EAH8202004.1 aminoglycoside N(3)-acetyltransferase [Campylobacter lari]EAJ5674853.1 aminoglycoside N(3)-acetyltransferase [Campylobacter lari]EAJ6177275.1 aminoglycoside N(3)-acetyltransferase [Campylobacter lari]EAJ6452550.1 aminoglycoside N(3)-acetyltransferase [Campylobacter lari]EAK0767135.1 aminoglycoside N(3)-acetyltransferase [Campylobacter lari]
MKYFLEHNDKKYSDIDLIEAFKKLGITKGDILCVHSELMKFGTPLLPRNEFLQTILDCFFEVIGKEGTLIMPTFTYKFCKNGIYNKLNSKSEVGILTEYFRKCNGVKRTNDPIFSFAIKGAKEELFLKDTTSCFGENCVYEILAKENGKLILFGSKIAGYTFSHFIEEKARVPYRYFKNFSGKIIDKDGKILQKNIKYYVRKLDENSDLDVDKQVAILENDNNFNILNFSNAHIVNINMKNYLEKTLKALKDNPYCLLKE